ncbi:uncharacterized protein PHACADRAFT_189816 [Phanerochaete carnosa HHB-10118-sp]|uniref:Uncharacterized protein n=1 Tax=Phanerochaete carnosa (strain HHB-10118-sp) TaxID=650164 RepID=K5VCM7_PHACS|nr:uncharacterized protein PHACADRAFT_189816 [Phanerochaete carnosa HHB-10118-sp]EKM60696.1 hypothetical protein PHACADRAFT_189816 [Phanerochaete carnosa HHB-10118-sp]
MDVDLATQDGLEQLGIDQDGVNNGMPTAPEFNMPFMMCYGLNGNPTGSNKYDDGNNDSSAKNLRRALFLTLSPTGSFIGSTPPSEHSPSTDPHDNI